MLCFARSTGPCHSSHLLKPLQLAGALQRFSTVSASRIAVSTTIITIGPPTFSSRGAESNAQTDALTQVQQRRVCVLSLPFVVPEMSVLRDALGKGELTAKWLQSSDAALSANAEGSSASDASRSALLQQIQSIAKSDDSAQSKGNEIHSALSKWIEATTADGRMLETLSAPDADTQFYSELLDVLLPATSQRSNKVAAGAAFFPRAALLALLKHPRATLPSLPHLKPASSNRAVTVQG